MPRVPRHSTPATARTARRDVLLITVLLAPPMQPLSGAAERPQINARKAMHNRGDAVAPIRTPDVLVPTHAFGVPGQPA
jgi:hypothetical protein